MSRVGRVALAILLAVTVPARAQSATELVGHGVRAYEELELDGATRYLRRALGVGGAQALQTEDRARALMYLAAVEWLQQHADSARAAARALVLLSPRYRPDRLVFPPEVQDLVGQARRENKVVAVQSGGPVDIRPGRDTFSVALFASSVHDVVVTLNRADGGVFRSLYAGPVADSLNVHWDGLNAAGGTTPAGRYTLVVTSQDERDRPIRTVRLPLEVEVTRDQVPVAAAADPRPRSPGAWDPALRAAVPALLVGATIVLLPRFVAPDEDATEARVLVGATVALSGVAAFLTLRPRHGAPATAPTRPVTSGPRTVVRLSIRPGDPVTAEARRE